LSYENDDQDAANAQSGNTFYIEVNKLSTVAGTANLSSAGQIVLTRVGYHAAGTQLRIVNGSAHAVKLVPASTSASSAGHMSLFRFADDAIE
jgi:hypothetical protein